MQDAEACPTSTPNCNAATDQCFGCSDGSDCDSGVCLPATAACIADACIVDVAADGSGGTAMARHSTMFAFYSNRLGCAGSILVSLVGTLAIGAVVYLLAR